MQYILQTDLYFLNIIQKLKNPVFDTLIPIITKLGDGGFVWILICVLCLFFKKTRKCGVVGSMSLVLNFVVSNLVLKNLVARTRPFEYNNFIELLINAPTDYSFPSGHTSASFSVATAIYLYNKKWGRIAYVFAFLIAFSRLYLYVHFPTDVICGGIIGIICGVLSKKIFEKTTCNKK